MGQNVQCLQLNAHGFRVFNSLLMAFKVEMAWQKTMVEESCSTHSNHSEWEGGSGTRIQPCRGPQWPTSSNQASIPVITTDENFLEDLILCQVPHMRLCEDILDVNHNLSKLPKCCAINEYPNSIERFLQHSHMGMGTQWHISTHIQRGVESAQERVRKVGWPLLTCVQVITQLKCCVWFWFCENGHRCPGGWQTHCLQMWPEPLMCDCLRPEPLEVRR